MKKGQKKKSSKNCTKSVTNKGEPSRSMLSDLKCIPEVSERLSGALQQKLQYSENSKESYDDFTHGLGPLGGMPEVDLSDDVVVINEDVTKTEVTVGEHVNSDENSQLKLNGDEDFELQAMFYLPTWRSASPPPSAELNPGREESLKVILANVEALLSRSPPALIEDLESDVAPPLFPLHPFPVSFTLDVDDDDMMASDPENDLMMSDVEESSVGQEKREISQSHAHVEQSASRDKTPSKALTWDDIFDDNDQEEDNCDDSKQVYQMNGEINAGDCIVEENPCCGADVSEEEVREWTDGVKDDPQMDNSMDLFGDDEAFLQMTIPDIPTPEVSPRTSPTTQTAQNPRSGEDAETNPTANAIAKAQKAQSTTDNAVTSDIHVQQTSFDKSHDLFSVHFDLGYSLEDSDEDREDGPVLGASASALPPKQADFSTPCSCTHKKPLQSKEPKLSTPLMPSEHRRTSVSPFFPSPPKGNAFPSPITTTRARRIILPSPSSPRTPCVLSSLKRRCQGDRVDQESVCALPLSPHPGRFHSSRNFLILHDLFCGGS